MKKFSTIVISLILTLVMTVSVSAASITGISVSVGTDSEREVQVTVNYNNPESAQTSTVLVVKEGESILTAENEDIDYVDQKEVNGNSVTYSLKMREKDRDGTYDLYVGGTAIEAPGKTQISFDVQTLIRFVSSADLSTEIAQSVSVKSDLNAVIDLAAYAPDEIIYNGVAYTKDEDNKTSLTASLAVNTVNITYSLDAVAEIEEVSATVIEGNAPVLPTQLNATTMQGTPTVVNVTSWDLSNLSVGENTVYGKCADTDVSAVALVTVLPASFTLEDILSKGNSDNAVYLPHEIADEFAIEFDMVVNRVSDTGAQFGYNGTIWGSGAFGISPNGGTLRATGGNKNGTSDGGSVLKSTVTAGDVYRMLVWADASSDTFSVYATNSDGTVYTAENKTFRREQNPDMINTINLRGNGAADGDLEMRNIKVYHPSMVTDEPETEDMEYIYSTAGVEPLSYEAITNGTIDMDVKPIEVVDNVIGITSSSSAPTWYDKFNIVIGFRPDGTILAYNSTAMDSEETITYEAGKVYHLHIETDVATGKFSAVITDEDGNDYTLATDYSYRASAPWADNLGKLSVVGGWNVGGNKLAVANVEFSQKEIAEETQAKTVQYVITGENGTAASWSEVFEEYEEGDILYDIPAGEYYYEHDGKAYVVRSEEQVYAAANDGIETHTVEFEIVHNNAVISDTFAPVDGAVSNALSDMLFIGSSGITDIENLDADGNSTMTGGSNVGNPRVPLLTFNVPEDYEEGKAVKLNVYVAKVNQNFVQSTAGEMKLAAGCVETAVNEAEGYTAADYAPALNLVWSDEFMSIPANATITSQKAVVEQWVSFDVTEFVAAASDTVTFTLYAPTAGAYVVDRESASAGGNYEGNAAYLEVVDGETISTTGMEKVTKMGSMVSNPENFVVPTDAAVVFYVPEGSDAFAVTDGSSAYTLTDYKTEAIDVTDGEYYVEEPLYSTAGFEAIEFEAITKGTIDMVVKPLEVTDNVIGITASSSNPTWYDQFNIVIRFKPDGTMDAYNGTVIESYEAVPYEAGKKYYLHIETDVEAGTFSAYVTDEEGNNYTLALDYEYRASAPDAEDLSKVTLIGGWGIGGDKLMAGGISFMNNN
ncbi:MAG: hypothetical protein IJ435_08205 [Clostridia bacterium]|nr:hypothetical protein [Clostridia bacterium]